jgi:hypothetical protein
MDLNCVVIVERHFHHPSSKFVPEKLKKRREKRKKRRKLHLTR